MQPQNLFPWLCFGMCQVQFSFASSTLLAKVAQHTHALTLFPKRFIRRYLRSAKSAAAKIVSILFNCSRSSGVEIPLNALAWVMTARQRADKKQN